MKIISLIAILIITSAPVFAQSKFTGNEYGTFDGQKLNEVEFYSMQGKFKPLTKSAAEIEIRFIIPGNTKLPVDKIVSITVTKGKREVKGFLLYNKSIRGNRSAEEIKRDSVRSQVLPPGSYKNMNIDSVILKLVHAKIFTIQDEKKIVDSLQLNHQQLSDPCAIIMDCYSAYNTIEIKFNQQFRKIYIYNHSYYSVNKNLIYLSDYDTLIDIFNSVMTKIDYIAN